MNTRIIIQISVLRDTNLSDTLSCGSAPLHRALPVVIVGFVIVSPNDVFAEGLIGHINMTHVL